MYNLRVFKLVLMCPSHFHIDSTKLSRRHVSSMGRRKICKRYLDRLFPRISLIVLNNLLRWWLWLEKRFIKQNSVLWSQSTFRTVISALWRFWNTNTLEVEPFIRTITSVAANHLRNFIIRTATIAIEPIWIFEGRYRMYRSFHDLRWWRRWGRKRVVIVSEL